MSIVVLLRTYIHTTSIEVNEARRPQQAVCVRRNKQEKKHEIPGNFAIAAHINNKNGN